MSRSRYILPVFTAAVLLTATTLSSIADDFLSRAAAQYRDKDFSAAYVSAEKSSDQNFRAFIKGMAAFRLGKFNDAALQLSEAELKLPLIADYSVLYQAESLLKLKRYQAALAKAASLPTAFPASKLLRRSEKLVADILFEAGDYKGAAKSYQSYIEKYPSGGDAIDASFQLALCKEATADSSGALLIYRNIWLNNPASSLASKSQDRIRQLERSGINLRPYTSEELLKRASALYAQNEFSLSIKTIEMIPESQPQAILNRMDLRIGMAQYRLRKYRQAEKQFVKAAASTLSGVRSEARFWLAKSLDRQDEKERALLLYLELADEGKKQEFADEALVEAGGLKRSLGQYAEAASLFERAARLSNEPKSVAKSNWDAGWCRYLAGDFKAAADVFKGLLNDDAQREKALYWLGKALERSGDATSASYFSAMQVEFPAGFYSTWYREQNGLSDSRETMGNRDPIAELPASAGYEKPILLASLGLLEEARIEITAIRKKSGEKKSLFPALARIYLEMRDYGSAIALFMQNRPIAWERGSLPLWTAGYPKAYSEFVSQNASLNGLPEGLVYALIRAESSFSPTAKSSAGAVGLMQMMPATAKLIAHEKGTFDSQRLTVPEYNIQLGTKHLKDLMKEHNGDVIFMTAAYNAGSGSLERWKKSYKGLKKDEFIESIPYQETRDYVKKVYASAATYRQLYGLK